MKKWICTVCGYVHEGEQPPEKCPQCGVPAEVVAVGPGTEDVKMEVSVGQKVIYSKYAGTEVKLEDEEFIIVKQNDILAVVE